MIYTLVIDSTASLAPAYFGLLGLLLISALGIVSNAWKSRWTGVSFSSGFELPSRSVLHWSK